MIIQNYATKIESENYINSKILRRKIYFSPSDAIKYIKLYSNNDYLLHGIESFIIDKNNSLQPLQNFSNDIYDYKQVSY